MVVSRLANDESLSPSFQAVLDKVYKAVMDRLKGKSFLQREIFKIVYERKLARYEDGYGKFGINL